MNVNGLHHVYVCVYMYIKPEAPVDVNGLHHVYVCVYIYMHAYIHTQLSSPRHP